MERNLKGPRSPGRPVLGALAWFCGALAWAVAAAIGAVIALIVAAAVVVIAVAASALLALSGAAVKARAFRVADDPTLLEARHVGGHSWVAYAADAPR